jgi:hypothetical protein
VLGSSYTRLRLLDFVQGDATPLSSAPSIEPILIEEKARMRSVATRFLIPAVAAVGLLLVPTVSAAAPVTINFDTLSDSEIILTQYPGLTFSNAIALTAGISLNELEFPPHSGSVVASDNAGPLRIDFAQPVDDVSGYFTYGEALTLGAFDASSALIGSVASAFSNNEAVSGDPASSPNEFLELPFDNISSVTFTGDPLGGSFTLDDFTYTNTTSVPEPGTVSMVLFVGICWWRSKLCRGWAPGTIRLKDGPIPRAVARELVPFALDRRTD